MLQILWWQVVITSMVVLSDLEEESYVKLLNRLFTCLNIRTRHHSQTLNTNCLSEANVALLHCKMRALDC